MKKILAAVAVFVTWEILDFVVHGVILKSAYAATANLWRPEDEMIMWVMFVAVFIAAVAFVAVFDRFFARKNARTGLGYGVWFGVGAGVSMGYGTYAVMPIPYAMAVTWCLGGIVEGALGGLVLGAILRERGA
jgi:hypothetical protein